MLINNEKINILLVDDDEVDIRAIKRAFKEQGVINPLTVAHNGREALTILRGEGPSEALKHPYLILLDLNMPQMNGIEFLAELRQDPCLKDSLVFVLTTSNDERDKVAAYGQHVSGYLLKTGGNEDLLKQAQMIKEFIFSVEFPPEHC